MNENNKSADAGNLKCKKNDEKYLAGQAAQMERETGLTFRSSKQRKRKQFRFHLQRGLEKDGQNKRNFSGKEKPVLLWW